MKRLPLVAIVVVIARSEVIADPNCIIDAGAGRIEASQAPVRAEVFAFGGKPLEVSWRIPAGAAAGGEPLVLRLYRVSGSRRIPLGGEEIAPDASLQQVTWKWDVPLTRGPAAYEVSLATPKPVVLRVEARDERLHREALEALRSAKLSAIGLTPEETAGLSGWGLKWETVAGSSHSGAVLSLVREQDGRALTRTIVLSDDRSDSVVWCAGAGSGEWRVRVARWWVSPSALATDEGRIRLVSLLCESPNPP